MPRRARVFLGMNPPPGTPSAPKTFGPCEARVTPASGYAGKPSPGPDTCDRCGWRSTPTNPVKPGPHSGRPLHSGGCSAIRGPD